MIDGSSGIFSLRGGVACAAPPAIQTYRPGGTARPHFLGKLLITSWIQIFFSCHRVGLRALDMGTPINADSR